MPLIEIGVQKIPGPIASKIGDSVGLQPMGSLFPAMLVLVQW
ncbi:Uncharacterised protein [marine metagenome]